MLKEKTTVEETPSPEETIQIEKKYARFSTASLILGCIALGLFSWISILIDAWAHWLGGRAAMYGFNSFFLIFAIVGLILGVISIEKGKRKYAQLGIIFNSIGVAIHVFVILFFVINIYIIVG